MSPVNVTANGSATHRLRAVQLAPRNLKLNPPWRVVLTRHVLRTPGLSLASIFRRMNLNERQVRNLRMHPDLRLSVAMRMAIAAEINPAAFVHSLAMATLHRPVSGSRKRRPGLTPIRIRPRDGKTCKTCHQYIPAAPPFDIEPMRPGGILFHRAALKPKPRRDTKRHLTRRIGGA